MCPAADTHFGRIASRNVTPIGEYTLQLQTAIAREAF
jgi:hypothetical protein